MKVKALDTYFQRVQQHLDHIVLLCESSKDHEVTLGHILETIKDLEDVNIYPGKPIDERRDNEEEVQESLDFNV